MARSTVTYADFSGGEFGRFGSAKAPKNSFTATNMIVTADGALCVRPGLVKRNPSGLASGVVHGFGNTPVPLNDIWFVQGTAVRTFSSAGDNLKTSGTTLAETPSRPVDWKTDGSTILLASPEDKVYRITPQGGVTVPTVAGLTGSPGGGCIEIYGDRIVVGDIDGSLDYRLRFSDAADPNSWPSANFVDVGDNYYLSGLYSQRQHLLITKQNQMYILTGTLGSSMVLRKVYTGNGPLSPLQARMGQRDLMWYQHIFAKHPSTFNGSIATELRHMEYTTDDPNSGGASEFPPGHGLATVNYRTDGAVFISDTGDKAAVFVNGAWTNHTFGVGVSGYVASNGQYIYLCDGGAAGAAPNFYAWDPTLDTPGIEGGSQSRAGDDSSTALSGAVSFPEHWAKDGDEFYVRAVVVDFVKYNTGSATNNHFDLVVNSMRRYQAGAAQASNTVSFDEAASSSSATGTEARQIFGFGEQGMGNGYQLVFTACKGIKIRRVEVILESQPVRV